MNRNCFFLSCLPECELYRRVPRSRRGKFERRANKKGLVASLPAVLITTTDLNPRASSPVGQQKEGNERDPHKDLRRGESTFSPHCSPHRPVCHCVTRRQEVGGGPGAGRWEGPEATSGLLGVQRCQGGGQPDSLDPDWSGGSSWNLRPASGGHSEESSTGHGCGSPA